MIYFFKNSEGLYVLGISKYDYVIPGGYSISSFLQGEIRYIQFINPYKNSKPFKALPYSSYLKEDGSPYGSFNELHETIEDFFVNAPVYGALNKRVIILEDTTYEYEIFQVIETTEGTINLPEESTLRLGQYEEAGNCLLVQVDSYGKPIDEVVRDSFGEVVICTLSPPR